MQVGELLKLTEEMRLSEIAKHKLQIGERKAREALKAAGCSHRPGKRGWQYEGKDKTILTKEIYEFVERPKARTFKGKIKTSNIQKNKAVFNDKNITRKRTSFDMDPKIKRALKVYAARSDKFEYEIVEGAIMEYIKKYPIKND